MFKRIAIILLVIAAVVGVYKFSGTAANDKKTVKNTYQNITGTELETYLKDKDFILIDVHIPEQEHIPGTDYVIPFNRINDIVEKIPNKNSKVVLYCRSGSMSRKAAQDLAEMGYENVYNLLGGMNEWKAKSRPTVPIGSITN